MLDFQVSLRVSVSPTRSPTSEDQTWILSVDDLPTLLDSQAGEEEDSALEGWVAEVA